MRDHRAPVSPRDPRDRMRTGRMLYGSPPSRDARLPTSAALEAAENVADPFSPADITALVTEAPDCELVHVKVNAEFAGVLRVEKGLGEEVARRVRTAGR